MTRLKFTRDHEWVREEGDELVIGISDYAQTQLGDIVYVELPPLGTEVERGKEAAVVESVKAASEVYAPVSGTITAINGALTDEPDRVNKDPEGEGWFFRLKPRDRRELEALMDEHAYRRFVEGLG